MTPAIPTPRKSAIALVALLLVCAACGSTETGASPGSEQPAGDATSTTTTSGLSLHDDMRTENSTMQITLTIDGNELSGTLDDTAPARELLEQLPLTLPLEDFHHSERIAYLPERVDTNVDTNVDTADDTVDGAAVEAGDIAYYAPWGNLALFYRTGASYTGGLVRLGRLEPGAAEQLAALDHDTRVTITRS